MSPIQHRLLQQYRSAPVSRSTPVQQQLAIRPLPRPSIRCTCTANDSAAPVTEVPLSTEVDQPTSITIPAPLGPTEPPNEEPKKLSPHARLSEDLASTSITIVGDDTELIWAVCQALSKKIGWFPVSTRKVLLGLHKAESIQEIINKEGREAVGENVRSGSHTSIGGSSRYQAVCAAGAAAAAHRCLAS